ncbi:MAG TPA: hypothetical protein VFJ51_02125 [Nitrososphaeraceae archaeon]|nr:hypothetical protein [Nitrososphaeraceae archaeon]
MYSQVQEEELSLRCIAYNMHRLTNLVIIIMISTEPVAEKRKNTFFCSQSLRPPLPPFFLMCVRYYSK